MVGQGRESQKDNDLFYTCGLIEYISRKTKNIRADVVNKLGKEKDRKIQENQIEKSVPKGAYEEILDYLNEKTNRNFRNIETNRKHIRARFNESKSSPYTVEDFNLEFNL